MHVTPRSRLSLLAQNLAFTLLFLAVIGLLAWLSTQYVYRADWTYGKRNSLSAASVTLLKSLNQPLDFTVYASNSPEVRQYARDHLQPYLLAKKDIKLDFVDIDRDPQVARDQDITTNGELVIGYGGRNEKITDYQESEISNAIQRLARSSERYVAFLGGDGERDLLGEHNFDLGQFGKQLTDKGFKVEPLNLVSNPGIPTNTSVLVVAGPQVNLIPGSVKLIRDYVKRGGNLLWLSDPGPLYGLQPLAEDLGLRFDAGTIVDPDTQLLGISDPTILLVSAYEQANPLTRDFRLRTVFPGATALETTGPGGGWQTDAFLKTLPRSWLETGKLQGEVSYDPKRGDKLGPLSIGLSLTRKAADNEQRVVVIGDGDFLSNAYLGNGGNLSLGLNIFNWLTHDDSLININTPPAPDLILNLSNGAQALIFLGFVLLLPIGLLAAGIGVWLRRRRR
ncbi:MAG TPA: GldG family protein [Gammaproteobacteria bacterium]|nr:GldG family protein [Gammaproteobacteria bacterium]